MKICFFVVLCLVSLFSVAESSNTAERFVAAHLTKHSGARYPVNEERNRIEGWVTLSYAVDTNGRAVDIFVEGSSGGAAFERSAVAALKRFQYEPATLNGEPKKQNGLRFSFTFHTSRDERGASNAFYSTYKATNNLISQGKLDEAETKITMLRGEKSSNLYERSYLELLRAAYESKRGNHRNAMNRLVAATYYDDGDWDVSGRTHRPFLPRKVYARALGQLYILQVQHSLYRDALDTYKRFKKVSTDKEKIAELKKTNNKIKKFVESDIALKVAGKIGERDVWSYQLLRRQFALGDFEGQLDKVDIVCERKRLSAKVAPGKAWKIPMSFGTCNIYVYGEEGAQFSLYEYPLKSS